MTLGRLSHWDETAVDDLARAWGVPLVEAYATLPSTNDRALALARDGAEPFTVVVADAQSRGRGRRGARWHGSAGHSLLLSVTLPPSIDGGGAAGPVTLVVGLCAAEAIEALHPDLEVAIEWPNDLFLGPGKVAGVLCEASGGAVVAGVGVNVGPGAADGLVAPLRPPASIEVRTGTACRRSILAGAIVEGLRRRLSGGQSPRLDSATLASLAERDRLRGRVVETESLGPCTATGIAPDGALRVILPDGSRARVVAGSVRLR